MRVESQKILIAGDNPKMTHSREYKMKRKTFMESWVEEKSFGKRLYFQEDVLMRIAQVKKPPK